MNDAIHPLFRRSRLLVFALCFLTALASPASLRSMRVPDALQTSDNVPGPAPDAGQSAGHVVRVRLAGMQVRMAVDPLARSPLDRRLEARVATLVPAPLPGKTENEKSVARLVAVKFSPLPDPGPLQASLAPSETAPRATQPSRTPRPDEVVAPATPGAPAPFEAASVLTVGDSLSIGLADALEKRFAAYPGVRFAKSGKVSSGLAQPSFYDWEARLEELALRHRPDLAFIMIATNDDKSVRAPSGKVIAFGGKGWDAEYGRRVQNLLDIVRRHNPDSKIFWVGAPVMADAGLNHRVRVIEEVIKRQVAKNENVWFVENARTLADPSGRFSLALAAPSGKTLQVRYKDGVHVTPAGANLLANACMSAAASKGLLAQNAPKTSPTRRNLSQLPELAEK